MAIDTQRPRQPPTPRTVNRPARQRGPQRPTRVRRIALFAALFCLVPVAVSYAQVVFETSNSSLGIRTVEWMRDNGARGLVNEVESIYYTLTAPATGGPGLKALPEQSGAVALAGPGTRGRHHRRVHFYRPANIQPVLSPSLPGEGVWRATFATSGVRPPVLITSFRADPNYPRLVAGVAWIDHTRTTTWLYPGMKEPDVSLPERGPMEVPPSMRGKLVATFNSAFKLKDSGGGFAYAGHTYAPMLRGVATILRYADGRVDVARWEGAPDVPADVVYARQNLPLIVDHGRPNPNLSDSQQWGFTLGNKVRVWRSAVGVDRHGNLIYAAAPIQTVRSLAAIMIRAGAVRAMELDINIYWTTFITYRKPGAVGAANLLSAMDRSDQRYLTPDDRDFFAVYLR